MLRMPKKVLYAVEAVIDIAYNSRPEPVQSREITRRQGIPARYLEQVMQQLVRAGVLKGVRGPRGGYTLARERRRITIGEIVRVIEAQEEVERDEETSSELGRQVVWPLWHDLRDQSLAKLDKITVESLCRTADDLGIPKESEDKFDYTI